MGKRRRCSGQEMLEWLQRQENSNDVETIQDQPQQLNNNHLEDQFTDVSLTDILLEDDVVEPSPKPNETESQQKEESLLIKVKGKKSHIIKFVVLFCGGCTNINILS